MSVTPRIQLVAYEDRVGGFVFVAVPNERGRYIRTDKSVVLVACPICRAAVGEPCRNKTATPDGYGGTTHAARRERCKAKHYGARGEDQIDPVGVEAEGFPSRIEGAVDRPPVTPAPARLFGYINLIEPTA